MTPTRCEACTAAARRCRRGLPLPDIGSHALAVSAEYPARARRQVSAWPSPATCLSPNSRLAVKLGRKARERPRIRARGCDPAPGGMRVSAPKQVACVAGLCAIAGAGRVGCRLGTTLWICPPSVLLALFAPLLEDSFDVEGPEHDRRPGDPFPVGLADPFVDVLDYLLHLGL
jgi:hypothetical protein